MAKSTDLPAPLLAADARNRAARTGLQTLIPLVFVAAVNAVLDAVKAGHLDWKFLGVAAAVAAGAVAVAYVQRRYVDPTGLPSLTPPTDSAAKVGAARIESAKQAVGAATAARRRARKRADTPGL